MDCACPSSTDWLHQSFRQLAAPFGGDIDNPVQGSRSTPAELSDAFYYAAVSGDDALALNLSRSLVKDDRWLKLVLATSARLQTGWASESLSVEAAMRGFWTTWRVSQSLSVNAGKTPTGHTKRGKILIWVPPEDQHTFGAHVLAERFEQAGWTAILLTHASTDTVLSRLGTVDIDLFGVSIGCDEQLLSLSGVLDDVRICSSNPNLVVLAGGPALTGDPKQYHFLGADVLARDADTALAHLGKRLDS